MGGTTLYPRGCFKDAKKCFVALFVPHGVLYIPCSTCSALSPVPRIPRSFNNVPVCSWPCPSVWWYFDSLARIIFLSTSSFLVSSTWRPFGVDIVILEVVRLDIFLSRYHIRRNKLLVFSCWVRLRMWVAAGILSSASFAFASLCLYSSCNSAACRLHICLFLIAVCSDLSISCRDRVVCTIPSFFLRDLIFLLLDFMPSVSRRMSCQYVTRSQAFLYRGDHFTIPVFSLRHCFSAAIIASVMRLSSCSYSSMSCGSKPVVAVSYSWSNWVYTFWFLAPGVDRWHIFCYSWICSF